MCHYSELVDWEAFNEQLVAGETRQTEADDEQVREEPRGEGTEQPDPLETVSPPTDD